MGPRISRRAFVFGLAGVGAAAAGGALYSRLAEPHWIETSRRKVPLPARKTGEPVRLIHLSDLHASPVVSLEFIADALALAIAEKPDLIALTGDFFTNRVPDRALYAKILRPLTTAAPTFACLGNHDGGPWARSAGGNATIDEALALLRAAGITCVHNECSSLTIRDRAFQMIGVGALWSGMCQPSLAFSRTPARGSATRILLNHNPDAKDALRGHDWDLMLCGHTHGGQLRLPLLGTPFAPVRDKRYVQGLHRWENRWLNITRGVGNLHGLRFNCRPEISVLELL